MAFEFESINAGFFAFRQEIFDYLKPGEELVEAPFQRLIARGRLAAYQYNGFWMPMDTFKDRQRLEELYGRGDAPWQVWKQPTVTDDMSPSIDTGDTVNAVGV